MPLVGVAILACVIKWQTHLCHGHICKSKRNDDFKLAVDLDNFAARERASCCPSGLNKSKPPKKELSNHFMSMRNALCDICL